VSADKITLTLPREQPFFAVAHLVLGGLAARHDLGYDELEDLQGALTLLLGEGERLHDVTLALRIEDEQLQATIGPFDAATLAELKRDAGTEVGLRRVLDTVVDRVEVTERDGQPWVDLHKSIHGTGVAT
jgi:hypothetical protein